MASLCCLEDCQNAHPLREARAKVEALQRANNILRAAHADLVDRARTSGLEVAQRIAKLEEQRQRDLRVCARCGGAASDNAVVAGAAGTTNQTDAMRAALHNAQLSLRDTQKHAFVVEAERDSAEDRANQLQRAVTLLTDKAESLALALEHVTEKYETALAQAGLRQDKWRRAQERAMLRTDDEKTTDATRAKEPMAALRPMMALVEQLEHFRLSDDRAPAPLLPALQAVCATDPARTPTLRAVRNAADFRQINRETAHTKSAADIAVSDAEALVHRLLHEGAALRERSEDCVDGSGSAVDAALLDRHTAALHAHAMSLEDAVRTPISLAPCAGAPVPDSSRASAVGELETKQRALLSRRLAEVEQQNAALRATVSVTADVHASPLHSASSYGIP